MPAKKRVVKKAAPAAPFVEREAAIHLLEEESQCAVFPGRSIRPDTKTLPAQDAALERWRLARHVKGQRHGTRHPVRWRTEDD